MGGGVEEEGAGLCDIGHWKFWLIKAYPPSETLKNVKSISFKSNLENSSAFKITPNGPHVHENK